MNSLTIGLIVSVVILILAGTSQRKRLYIWFRSESNAAIKKLTNTIKVLDLRISDSKVAIKNLVERTGDLYAQELEYIKCVGKLAESVDVLRDEAKKAKKDGKDDLAKAKLTLLISSEKELISMNKNLEIVSSSKQKLELKITKLKNQIKESEIRILGLKAKRAATDSVKEANKAMFSIDGTTINESIDEIDKDLDREEVKLEYVSNDINEEEDYSEEVSKRFEELK